MTVDNEFQLGIWEVQSTPSRPGHGSQSKSKFNQTLFPENCRRNSETQETNQHYLHFRYGTKKHVLVLRGYLYVKPGQYAALEGISGSGKSTMVSLIEQFYDVLSGEVLVDGKNISTLNIRSYRQRVASVSQEQLSIKVLFERTCFLVQLMKMSFRKISKQQPSQYPRLYHLIASKIRNWLRSKGGSIIWPPETANRYCKSISSKSKDLITWWSYIGFG